MRQNTVENCRVQVSDRRSLPALNRIVFIARIFIGTFVWQLPAMAHANPVVRRVAGGWEAAGLVTLQSGAPLTILAGKDQSQTNLRDRAVISGVPYGTGACGSAAPCVNYLNTASFALPATGGFGNVGKGLLSGPGLASVDMSFSKMIPVRERLQFQLFVEVHARNLVSLVCVNRSTTPPACGAHKRGAT